MTAAQKSARLTELRLEYLKAGVANEFHGGFAVRTYRQFLTCEVLRKHHLLKRWNNKRSRDWRRQFFDITDAGRAALAQTAGSKS